MHRPLSGRAVCRVVHTAILVSLFPVVASVLSAQRSASSLNVDTLLVHGMRYRMVGPFRGGRATAVTGVAGQPTVF